MEFDIWTDFDGQVTAVLATRAFVDDADAPYGYHTHQVRVTANSKRAALKFFNSVK